MAWALVMGSTKAPVLDGYPALFYQLSWSNVGPSVCNFVLEVWGKELDLSFYNATVFALIPKTEKPDIYEPFSPYCVM